MTILDEIQKFLASFLAPKQPLRVEKEPRRIVNIDLPDKRDWEIIGN